MSEMTPKHRQIITEWEKMEKNYEHAKKELRDVLNKHGLASREFNAAKIDFEMIKEQFDNFEKENHHIIAQHKR